MKRISLLFLFFVTSFVNGQNLVQNPGLDLFITCPAFGQFGSTWIPFWEKPSIASSDYYNFNCPGIQPTVQAPMSGEGYAGIICYNLGTEYREYITGTFSSPLIAGMLYDVEFWVNLNNGYIQAINEVGAYISNTMPGPFPNALHISVTPQVENTSGPLADTANWKQVYGQYFASGGEQYITIGNFHDDAGTTITQPGTVGSFGAYYYIDDVSVSLVASTGLNETDRSQKIRIYMDEELRIHIDLRSSAGVVYPVTCSVADVSGKQVFETKLFSEYTILSPMQSSATFFMIRLQSDDGKLLTAKKVFVAPR